MNILQLTLKSNNFRTTEKLPIVRKELIKLGKSRGEVERRLADKLEQHQQKHRNRSRVGAIIQM